MHCFKYNCSCCMDNQDDMNTSMAKHALSAAQNPEPNISHCSSLMQPHWQYSDNPHTAV
jgi:hypothetical protein